jgi:protein translocase SEC61 complex gamma subunit
MLASYKRVLIIARKPDKEDFIKTAKICFIGMGIIGLIGFIIYAISILFLA